MRIRRGVLLGALAIGGMVLLVANQLRGDGRPIPAADRSSATPAARALQVSDVTADPSGSLAVRDPPPTDASREPALVARAQRSGVPERASTLPRATPLADVFEELARRADNGDQEAACRLAWDLGLCRTAQHLDPDFWIDSAATEPPGSSGEEASLAIAAWNLARLDRAQQICKDLPPAMLHQAHARMAQAARLGHPLSMAYFAGDPGSAERLSLDQLDTLNYFRDNAFLLLQRSAAAGEPVGLLELHAACRDGRIRSTIGDLTVPQDPGCALATALAVREVADGQSRHELDVSIGELRAGLDPAARARAEERAQAYRQRIAPRPLRDYSQGLFRGEVGETCVPPPASP